MFQHQQHQHQHQHHLQPKPFPPVIPHHSLLGAPPGGRGVAPPITPFLNAGMFGRGRGVKPPQIPPTPAPTYKKPAAPLIPFTAENGEISNIQYTNLV